VADHQLHALVPGFADVADDYERGRPPYPPALLAAVRERVALPPGARVLDLAAGTGKLTRILRDDGLDVVAVEPLPGMRERLQRNLGPGMVLDGSAEALPLADASVDAVFCGDAFHWFDGVAAAAEIARVLRPGGAAVFTWLVPAGLDGNRWAAAIGEVLAAVRPEHPGFTPDRGIGALDGEPRLTPRVGFAVPFEFTTDVVGLRAYVASFSYVGAMAPADRAALLDRISEAVHDAPLPLRMAYIADAWLTTRRA
jgi:SAM-dependent methyltransferase